MVGRRGILALVISVALLIGIGVMVQTVSALEYVTVTYPNGGENVTGTITITWDSNSTAIDTIYIQYSDDGGDQYHPIDSVAGDARSYDWDTTSVADGTLYKIRIIVYDSLNSTQVIDTSNDNFTIDNTPPISSVDSILPYWQTTSPITITVTATDTTSDVSNVTLWYRFSTDNSSWGAWTYFGKDTDGGDGWSFDFNFPSGEGHYEFYSIANDSVGNTEPAPEGADTICGYDATPPTSSVDPISPYWDTTGSVTITVTATDTTSDVSNVTLWYRFSTDNSSWGAWTYFGKDTDGGDGWSFDFNFPSGEGHYEFYSIANDSAGNTETKSPSAEAICGYDATGPTVTITFPEDESFYNTPILNVNGTASDTLSGVKVVKVSLVNQSTGAWWDFRNGIWQTAGSPQVYNATGTDSWDLNSTTAPYWPSWSDGTTYEFHAFAFDYAGNIGTVAISTFTYDITAPISSVNPISPYWDTTGSVTITVTATDTTSDVSNVTLWYRFSTDNSSWGAWTYFGKDTDGGDGWSFDFNFPSGEGHYEFYSIANDSAGNTETKSPSAEAICGYDATGPTVTITFPEDESFYNTPILNITGEVSDNLSGVESVQVLIGNITNVEGDIYIYIWNWSSGRWDLETEGLDESYYFESAVVDVDNETWYLNNETALWPNWEDGQTYGIYVYALDVAGNDNESEVYFAYDTAPPTSSVNPISPYWNTTGSVTITVTASDTLSGLKNVSLYYYYSENNETWQGPYLFGTNETPWVGISWNFTFPNGTGYYRFYSIAIDNASNVEEFDGNDSVCGYDATPPEVETTIPADGGYYADIDNITGTVSDATSGVDTVQVAIYKDNYYWWEWSTESWVDPDPLFGQPFDPSTGYATAIILSDGTWYINSGLPEWENTHKYTITAVAYDNASNSASVYANFTILGLHLYEGWNLVSVPRELENASIEVVFENITAITRVYYYDPISGWKWAFYNNETESWDTSGGLTTIDDGKGYWIYATAETSVALTLKEINPIETPPTYPVKAGWNLIGYTTLSLETSTPIDAYLQNLYTGFGPKWTKLYRYTPGTGYEMATPWYTDYFDTFDLTRGYWLYCSEDGEIVP